MVRNKLNVEQREKSGSETFSKYDYQYHWALYKAISLTRNRVDYVIMVEMHEDVIIGDSADRCTVKFDFNQVKTTDRKYNIGNMTDRKKSTKGELLPSVLGKLLSYQTKFENPDDIISSYNLVASNGFNIKLKEKRDYADIGIDDLEASELKLLKESLCQELNLDDLPKNIHFVVSSLPEEKFHQCVEGIISEVMFEVFGTSHGALGVYQALIDDLHRKGQVRLDFKNWDNLLEEKAITSVTVEKVIGRFTDQWTESVFQKYLDDCIKELSKTATYNTALRNEVSTWLTERTDMSSHTYLLSDQVSSAIKDYMQDNDYPPLKDIADYVWNKTSIDSDLYKSSTSPKFMAIIICEYLNIIKDGTRL